MYVCDGKSLSCILARSLWKYDRVLLLITQSLWVHSYSAAIDSFIDRTIQTAAELISHFNTEYWSKTGSYFGANSIKPVGSFESTSGILLSRSNFATTCQLITLTEHQQKRQSQVVARDSESVCVCVNLCVRVLWKQQGSHTNEWLEVKVLCFLQSGDRLFTQCLTLKHTCTA